MKLEELRIGNWVWNPVQKIPVQVDIALLNGIYYYEKANKDIGWEPISVTEQLLFDFGFEKKSYKTKVIVIECFYYELDYFIVYLVADFFEVELVTGSGYQFNLFKKWYHVHQLQNLYFDLMGKELIKVSKNI